MLAFVIPLLGLAGQPNPPELRRFEDEESHMGTKIRIVLYAEDKASAVSAFRAGFKRFRELEAVLSDYRADSEILKLARANDAAPGKPLAISDELARVLGPALEVSAKSGGAFDVTVGPLSLLWRQARKAKQLPPQAALDAALAKVGYGKLALDAKAKTLTFAVAGMRLDFGGIGKGHAADEALAAMAKLGATRAMVAASGDVAVGDAPPGLTHWTVAIAPIGTGKPERRVYLANAAVSTSGDLFQFVELGGVRYSHVLNPATGLGLTGRRSVTVIAPRGLVADAYSKVASVLPPAKALAIIEGMDKAAAYIVVKETDAAPDVATESKRFAGYAK